MAIFLSYELGFSARFSSAKLHKIVDICKKNRNYFIDNQIFILNFSIDYIEVDSDGSIIHAQNFEGDPDASLGGGLLIMAAAGAGYLLLKKKEEK